LWSEYAWYESYGLGSLERFWPVFTMDSQLEAIRQQRLHHEPNFILCRCMVRLPDNVKVVIKHALVVRRLGCRRDSRNGDVICLGYEETQIYIAEINAIRCDLIPTSVTFTWLDGGYLETRGTGVRLRLRDTEESRNEHNYSSVFQELA
jgi:hypothetical protein